MKYPFMYARAIFTFTSYGASLSSETISSLCSKRSQYFSFKIQPKANPKIDTKNKRVDANNGLLKLINEGDIVMPKIAKIEAIIDRVLFMFRINVYPTFWLPSAGSLSLANSLSFSFGCSLSSE